jgi:hypothetical protein
VMCATASPHCSGCISGTTIEGISMIAKFRLH